MRNLILFIGMGIILFTGCVAPEQQKTIDNRISALEAENGRQASLLAELGGREARMAADLESIRSELQTDGKSIRENTAEIKYEINRMKERFQQLEGLIEEIKYSFGSNTQVQSDEQEKRLDRLDNAISRNYEKIINLEKYMGFEPTAAKQADPGTDTAERPRQASEQELYDFAKKLFDDGDLENARIQFENFINKYPDSKNADNARFWIADSFYAEKWYEKAILEYQKVLENYPKSNKNAAARLKQGYSFAELGEKANARLILNELIKRHPKSKEAAYAKEKLKNLN